VILPEYYLSLRHLQTAIFGLWKSGRTVSEKISIEEER
jgi:hypothetical protein